MFDWLIGGANTHEHMVTPPIPAPSDVSKLSYETGRVMLMKGVDAPFLNNYWDYVVKGPDAPELIYSEKINHLPLFSSKDQLLASSGKCIGKLHFTRTVHPESIRVDPDGTVVTKSVGGYVVSQAGAVNESKSASIALGESIPAELKIGGGGPGSAEMSAKIHQGSLKSKTYQQLGPHYLGRVLRDGSWCMEPSAMEIRENIAHEFGEPPDSLIQTG